MLIATLLKIERRSVVVGFTSDTQPPDVPTLSTEKNLSGVDAIARMVSQAERSTDVEVAGVVAATVTVTVVSV